jgi:hypothetical protein
MKKKRNPKKRIGTSLALVAVLLAAVLPLGAAPKKKPVLDVYAVVSGSIFQDNGYALPGADVTLVPEIQPGSSSERAREKVKPIELMSDARGEFVVRVPPGPMQYVVTVDAKGYKSQRKTVSVQDQERVEVTFQLERESK